MSVSEPRSADELDALSSAFKAVTEQQGDHLLWRGPLARLSPIFVTSRGRERARAVSCVTADHLEMQPRRVRSEPRKRKSPAERLAAMAVPRDDGCLMWTGHKDLHGYGSISVNGRPTSTHRLAWSLANGMPVSPGMQVRHTCDEPLCINPDHLQIGTAEDSRRDRRERGRSARGTNNRRPQLKAADRAKMLATKEVGCTLADIAAGWAMAISSVSQALALARRERAAASRTAD